MMTVVLHVWHHLVTTHDALYNYGCSAFWQLLLFLGHWISLDGYGGGNVGFDGSMWVEVVVFDLMKWSGMIQGLGTRSSRGKTIFDGYRECRKVYCAVE